MAKLDEQPYRVSGVAWRCPCGRDMGIAERPVCDCGEWTLDGPVEKPKQLGGARVLTARDDDGE